jgi:hypothetical protein
MIEHTRRLPNGRVSAGGTPGIHVSLSNFTLASARAAAEHDDIARWVGEFLSSRGSDNATLAAGLAQRRHWWLGPLELPIERLERRAGPEPDVECPIEPEEWEHDVDAIDESLEQGWEPPPLLARYDDGHLWLEDGNHRYEALARAGATRAWVIVWFDAPADRDNFLASAGGS